MSASDLIQLAAVLAAVGAAIAALSISAVDRKNSRQIAAADRTSAIRQAHLLFELEMLTQLTQNLNRGGSDDARESERLGAEALTLVGSLRPELLPNLWERKIGSDDRLRAASSEPGMPEYKRDALEAQLALSAVLRELREEAGEA